MSAEQPDVPETSWQDWLVMQSAESTDVGRFANFLIGPYRDQADFGSVFAREQMCELFRRFEADTNGMRIIGPPIKFYRAQGGALISQLREAVTSGREIDRELFVEFLDMLNGVAGILDVLLRSEEAGDAARPVLRQLYQLLAGGRPHDSFDEPNDD